MFPNVVLEEIKVYLLTVFNYICVSELARMGINEKGGKQSWKEASMSPKKAGMSN